MSHHQGMSFLSIAYLLLGKPMQKRFTAELQFQATMLLLQERIPKTTVFYAHATDIGSVPAVTEDIVMKVIDTPNTPIPEVQLLSNGRYHVMITNAGGGYSRWNGLALTRWREDATCDNWGTFCYLRDIEDGAFWSNTYQPTLKQPKNYEVTFVQGRAEFRRRDHYIDTHTELVVSPEDDIEMRRIRITNHSRRPRIIEVTSYCEVVLTSAMSDAVHPAFSNLFVQTDILDQRNAILCTRRARGVDEHPPSMFHLMTHNGGECIETSYETDRMKFIGRGKTVAEPMVMIAPGALSNTQGSVLDPIASIRYLLAVQPDETVTIDMITGAGESKEICHALIDKYQDKHHKDRVFEMAWTHSQVVLRQINATESDAQIYSQLASSIIYTNQSLRADPAVIQRNQRGQSGLWGYSISGDLPIVLVEITEQANLELVKQMVQAHAYWRLKGLATDLVIWNEDHGGYRQVLQNQILGLIATGAGTELTDQPGGIFVRASDQISNEDRLLFQAVARINISDKRGMLDTILNQQNTPRNPIPFLTVAKRAPHTTPSVIIPEGLIFFNGFGGFMPGGKEYCIITKNGSASPAPWVNVLANPEFGTVISESGQAYTWSENAHEYRLSPWENDPVCDKSGEAFYIRDEETGHFWSPSPLPAAGTSPYITRHGFGYSIFEHNEDAIACEMQVFVDIEAPVKFVIIKLTNLSEKQRRISATGFIEWVLGDIKPKTAMHIIAEQDMGSGVMFARNPYNKEFEGRVAFFDTDDSARTVTADRTEFLGRNGTLKNPDAMGRARLSGKTGAALDPCAAIQTTFTLQPGQVREVIFRLGAGKNLGEAKNLAAKYKGTLATYESLSKVRKFWEHTLSSLQIETPNQSLNILTNGWLMYQTLASRLWARSGYYQSGGAFGFRDQLQDVVALTQSQPAIARHQILLCASRQFLEGDVQHWWHPPVGRGVRTRCSDDLLWLPYVTSAYIQRTGDNAILDESVEFLDGRLLNPGEESYYDLPAKSGLSASLYQHCVRAIEQGMKFGSRGLPLFGSGDWNDGMDQVGKEGKGESIWLGFFLYDVLTRFTPIATDRRDNSFADKCTKEAGILQANIEKNGWDGNWYRRGYFDDGKPLGSSKNDECQVDSISQSWAIISGAGNAERTAIALASADKRLVKPDGMFIQLLDPPFDKSAMNPGYIKGYVPGIRENGGQYTHAAVWMIMAYAASGNAKRAWELMEMINPLNHGSTAEKIAIYKTEPYVVAADIYSVTQNFGRGGWTWYTGSAGWMYQLIIDWLIGIKRDGNKLRFTPCLPEEWNDCTVNYRFQETTYQINFKNNTPGIGTIKIIFDGEEMPDNAVYLADDKKTHVIEVRIFSDKLYSPQKVSISAAAGVA
jgi:cyclic beta-1,2-glucan synthetase